MVGDGLGAGHRLRAQQGSTGEAESTGEQSSGTFVRVAGLNESPLAVTIASTEKSSDGTSVNLLDGDISDELRALYPISIPANSKNATSN